MIVQLLVGRRCLRILAIALLVLGLRGGRLLASDSNSIQFSCADLSSGSQAWFKTINNGSDLQSLNALIGTLQTQVANPDQKATDTASNAVSAANTLLVDATNALNQLKSQQQSAATSTTACQKQQDAYKAATDAYNSQYQKTQAEYNAMLDGYNQLKSLLAVSTTIPGSASDQQMTAAQAWQILRDQNTYAVMQQYWPWYTQCMQPLTAPPSTQAAYTNAVMQACAQWCLANNTAVCTQANALGGTNAVIQYYCKAPQKAAANTATVGSTATAQSPLGYQVYWNSQKQQFIQNYQNQVAAYKKQVAWRQQNCSYMQKQLAAAMGQYWNAQNVLYAWAYNNAATIQSSLTNAAKQTSKSYTLKTLPAPAAITNVPLGGDLATSYNTTSNWQANGDTVYTYYNTILQAINDLGAQMQKVSANLANAKNWQSFVAAQNDYNAVQTCLQNEKTQQATVSYQVNQDQGYIYELQTLKGCLTNLQVTLANRVYSQQQASESKTDGYITTAVVTVGSLALMMGAPALLKFISAKMKARAASETKSGNTSGAETSDQIAADANKAATQLESSAADQAAVEGALTAKQAPAQEIKTISDTQLEAQITDAVNTSVSDVAAEQVSTPAGAEVSPGAPPTEAAGIETVPKAPTEPATLGGDATSQIGGDDLGSLPSDQPSSIIDDQPVQPGSTDTGFQPSTSNDGQFDDADEFTDESVVPDAAPTISDAVPAMPDLAPVSAGPTFDPVI